MLVIARKNGQKIIINDNIEVTVIETKPGSCRLAIKAPLDVKIYREEVYMQIKLANMVGQNTTDDLVAQVDAILKNPDGKVNKSIVRHSDEEFIADKQPNKRIIIKKINESNDR